MGSWYVFYFMFVVFFGSFYLINLVLAVVAVSYQQEVVSMQERVRCYVMINSLRTLTPMYIKQTLYEYYVQYRSQSLHYPCPAERAVKGLELDDVQS